MILTDAHAHFYPCYQPRAFICSAFKNFIQAERQYTQSAADWIIFLAEVSGSNYFSEFKKSNQAEKDCWRVEATEEACTLKLIHADYQDRAIFLIGGQQLVSEEKIEVLAIGSSELRQHTDSLQQTVASVLSDGGIAILPWGAGKWLGRRGRLIAGIKSAGTNPLLFLGDNGSRPTIWPVPRLTTAKAGVSPRLLSGTDPLPLPGEEQRVGSFGSCITGNIDHKRPFTVLKQILTSPETGISPFGTLQSPLRFLKQQAALRRAR